MLGNYDWTERDRGDLFLKFSSNVSICLVCCVLDSVCELFGETIRDVFVLV